jgi:hypothetical protein
MVHTGAGIVLSAYKLGYELNVLGFKSWFGATDFLFSKMSRPALLQPSLLFNNYQASVQEVLGLMLITCLHIVPNLRMGGDKLMLPLCILMA